MSMHSMFFPVRVLGALMVAVMFFPSAAALGGSKPAAPAGLNATLNYPRILLGWRANPEPNITGYHVYRSLASKTGYTRLTASAVTGLTYTDTPAGGNKTYYYKVSAVSAAGEGAASAPLSIYFYDNAPPLISAVAVSAVTGTGAVITWRTDEASSSQADYGTSSSYGLTTPLNPSLVTSHTVALAGLANDTLIHYRVRSADAGGNTAVSSDFSFRTLDLSPPAPVTAFAVSAGDGQNTLAWTNPATADFAGTIIRYSTGGYPASPGEGALLCDRKATPGSSDAFTHTGLSNGTTYYYVAFAYDEVPNFSAVAQTLAVPHETRPPVIAAVGTSGIGADWALVDWLTDEVSGTGVRYGDCASQDRTLISGPGPLTDHAALIPGLLPDVVYCYEVTSSDSWGNTAVSATHSFRTIDGATAACLACHDGTAPAAPFAGDFAVEGHGKGGVSLTCADCHEDHLSHPVGYKYLKTVNSRSYPNPYPAWEEAVRSQKQFCTQACHVQLPAGVTHPVADEPILTDPPQPYAWACSAYTRLPGIDMPLLDADLDGLQSCGDVVMCVSCHNPHGRAGAEFMLREGNRYEYSALCLRCHQY